MPHTWQAELRSEQSVASPFFAVKGGHGARPALLTDRYRFPDRAQV